MSSKFFNNNSGNTLFDKLKGVACNAASFMPDSKNYEHLSKFTIYEKSAS